MIIIREEYCAHAAASVFNLNAIKHEAMASQVIQVTLKLIQDWYLISMSLVILPFYHEA